MPLLVLLLPHAPSHRVEKPRNRIRLSMRRLPPKPLRDLATKTRPNRPGNIAA